MASECKPRSHTYRTSCVNVQHALWVTTITLELLRQCTRDELLQEHSPTPFDSGPASLVCFPTSQTSLYARSRSCAAVPATNYAVPIGRCWYGRISNMRMAQTWDSSTFDVQGRDSKSEREAAMATERRFLGADLVSRLPGKLPPW